MASSCAGSCPGGYQSLFSHCALTLVKVSKTKMKVLVRSTSVVFFFFFGHTLWYGRSQFPDQCPRQWTGILSMAMMAREVPQQNKVGGLWGVPSESSGHVASSGRLLDLSQSAVPSCESKEEEGTSVKCRNSTVKCWILRADSVRGFAISLNVRWNALRKWKLGV